MGMETSSEIGSQKIDSQESSISDSNFRLKRLKDIASRQKNVIIAEPLAMLEADSNVKGNLLRQIDLPMNTVVDLRYVGLAVLDFILERSAFNPGALPDEVREEALRQVQRMLPDIEVEKAIKLSNHVLDKLSNSTGRRHGQIATTYYDVEHGDFRLHMFAYIETFADPDDSAVVWTRLARGGKLLMIGMLDVSEQVLEQAERFIMQFAFERGLFSDALKAAAQSRNRAIGVKVQIDNVLRHAHRNPERIDYDDHLKPYLEQAIEHLSQRQAQDHDLHDRLLERLTDVTLAGDPRQSALDLKAALEDCQDISGRLLIRLQTARSEFRDRMMSGFHREVQFSCRDPEEEILLPMLEAEVGMLAQHADRVVAACTAPIVEPILYIPDLFERLISVEAEGDARDDGDDTLVDLVPHEKLLPDHRILELEAWIDERCRFQGQVTLSAILREAVRDGMGHLELRAIVLILLGLVSLPPVQREEKGLDVDIRDHWVVVDMCGDDILFTFT